MNDNTKTVLKGHIHSTESFGTVDGPGIRFVIFFQGCPMRCLYCHNPDTWSVGGGREVTTDELLAEYESVKEFMRGGGITCTGGEPTLQMDFLTELFEKAHEKGIHTCLDSCGVTFNKSHPEKFERLIRSTDLVMLDIKHIDPDEHKKLTGHGNKNILELLEYLSQIEKPVWIRHVLVPGITDNDEYLTRTRSFIDTLKNVERVEVLPYHSMGEYKWQELGLEYTLKGTAPPDSDRIANAKAILKCS